MIAVSDEMQLYVEGTPKNEGVNFRVPVPEHFPSELALVCETQAFCCHESISVLHVLLDTQMLIVN